MKRILMAAALALAGVGCSGDDKKDKKDGKINERTGDVVVDLGGLKAKLPKGWVDKGTTQFRKYSFQLPAVTGDSGPAEVYVSDTSSGDRKANIDRWKGQFKAPSGKTIDEVSKESEVEIGGKKALLFEIAGDFQGGPGGSSGKITGAKQVAVDLDLGERKRYFIIFRGPAATVEKHRKDFDDWLKSFK